MTPTTPLAQPTPPNAKANPRASRRKALAAGVLCAAALIGASGCGESNGTPAAATPPATTATAPSATQTSTPAQPSTGTTATNSAAHDAPPAAHHGRSALAKARARAAFQSLANAKPAPKLTPTQQTKLPISDIQLTSPDINTTTNTLATANTCYGTNQHPTLRWKNIPPGTAEIAIAILSTKPVNNQLFYDWTIAGIPPTTHEIPAGQTPPGAITAQNSYGHPTYNICPPTGTQETYAIIIYALPTPLHQTPNFNPTTLHTQIQHTTHHTGLLITTYHHT